MRQHNYTQLNDSATHAKGSLTDMHRHKLFGPAAQSDSTPGNYNPSRGSVKTIISELFIYLLLAYNLSFSVMQSVQY